MFGTDREMQGGNRVEKKAAKRESLREKGGNKFACLKQDDWIYKIKPISQTISYISPHKLRSK